MPRQLHKQVTLHPLGEFWVQGIFWKQKGTLVPLSPPQKAFISRAIGRCEPLSRSVVCAFSVVQKLLMCLDNLSALPVCYEMKKVEGRCSRTDPVQDFLQTVLTSLTSSSLIFIISTPTFFPFSSQNVYEDSAMPHRSAPYPVYAGYVGRIWGKKYRTLKSPLNFLIGMLCCFCDEDQMVYNLQQEFWIILVLA